MRTLGVALLRRWAAQQSLHPGSEVPQWHLIWYRHPRKSGHPPPPGNATVGERQASCRGRVGRAKGPNCSTELTAEQRKRDFATPPVPRPVILILSQKESMSQPGSPVVFEGADGEPSPKKLAAPWGGGANGGSTSWAKLLGTAGAGGSRRRREWRSVAEGAGREQRKVGLRKDNGQKHRDLQLRAGEGGGGSRHMRSPTGGRDPPPSRRTIATAASGGVAAEGGNPFH
eukprot:gene8265-biopygen21137